MSNEECCDDKCCKQDKCCEKQHEGADCEMTSMMLTLADQAWSDLMKEKMKAAFEKTRGAKMDLVAETSVEAAIACWETKMQGEMNKQNFSENLKKAFMSK